MALMSARWQSPRVCQPTGFLHMPLRSFVGSRPASATAGTSPCRPSGPWQMRGPLFSSRFWAVKSSESAPRTGKHMASGHVGHHDPPACLLLSTCFAQSHPTHGCRKASRSHWAERLRRVVYTWKLGRARLRPEWPPHSSDINCIERALYGTVSAHLHLGYCTYASGICENKVQGIRLPPSVNAERRG